MKKNPFISRLATSVAAVALTIGTAFTFSACSDDDEVVDPAAESSRLSVPVVNKVAEADITTSSLKFSWEAVEGASSYSAQIRLSEAGDIYRERIIENATEVTFENLDDDTEYYFRVRANHKLNESRNSAYSVYTKVTTVAADPAIPQLAVPANVMCDKAKTSETELTFMWDTVENASAGYAITLTSIGVDDFTATTTETSYTFTGLESGRQYFFTVRACEVKEGDNVLYAASKNSGAVKAMTVGRLPVPANLKFQDKMAHAVKFVWDAVDNAKDYAYELQTLTVNGDPTTVDEGLMSELSDAIVPGKIVYATATSNTSMTFVGLDNDAYYSFRVKAIPTDADAYLESEFTDYCVIKTLEYDPTPLGTPKFTIEAQQVKVLLAWKEVTSEEVGGVAGYDIQFAPAGTEVADDDAAYTITIHEADETTGELPLETAVSTYGPDAKAVEPEMTYKVRMRTYADENNAKVANSSWTDWKEVKTPALAKELTVDDTEPLVDNVARMAEDGVLTLEAGTYNVAKKVTFTRGLKIAAANGASVTLNINGNSFDVAANAKIGTIEFDNLTFIGKKSVGGGDHIFNVSKGIKCTIEHVKFVNCNASDYERSFLRTQADTEVIENVTIENCVISVVSGTSQTYDVLQLGIAPVTTTIKNSTFTNIAAFVRFNAALASGLGNVAVENCSFYSRSGGQYFNMKSASVAEISVKNCVFAGTLLKVGNNANSANNVKTASGNFAASDIAWSTLGEFVTAADWATAESLTSAELFPNAGSGDYTPAESSQAKAAGAGDPRWLKE